MPSPSAPSNSPRVTSVTVVELDGMSKTVNCCESEEDNNECQSLLAIAEAESLDECTNAPNTPYPSASPLASPSAVTSLLKYQVKVASCADNHRMVQIADAIATATSVNNNTPTLSEECSILLGLDSDRRLAEGEEGVSLQKIVLRLPDGHKTASDVYEKVNEVEEKEDGIQKTLDRLMSGMATILEEMLNVDPKNNAKSKKSKRAKGEKEAAQEEDPFKRNLLAAEEVKDEFDKMESQSELVEGKVESMESKIESMEGKVESIEGKVDSIEKTIGEMKEMMSQLLAKGGVVVD